MSDDIHFVPADTQLFSRVHAHLASNYIVPLNVFGPGKLKISLGMGPSKEEFSIQISAQDNGVFIKMMLSIYALNDRFSSPVTDGSVVPTLYQLLPKWFPSCTIGTEAWSAMKLTAFHSEWTPELTTLLDNAMLLTGIPAVWRGD
jgi:hypothetical protein